MNYTNENDFKYVLQDVSTTAFGARMTYENLLMHERVPVKFQNIINLYILRFQQMEHPERGDLIKTEIGENILQLECNELVCDVFRKLKVKIKFCKKQSSGSYKAIAMPFEKFMKLEDRNDRESVVLQEIVISNFALMTYSV